MLFNSFGFALFLISVFVLHWFVMNRSGRSQNLILMSAGFVFYFSWHWKFLLILAAGRLIDYYCSVKIFKAAKQNTRRFFFLLPIFLNIGALVYFKYWNYFISGITGGPVFSAFNQAGLVQQYLIPIGISFYTLQSIGYIIDVYLEKSVPADSLIDYMAFSCFFPLALAGPIERTSNLLKQLRVKRDFDYENAAFGLRLLLWGLFKKIVIADSCAAYVSYTFSNPAANTGSTLILGAILFSFQIYADFSGYSDMAVGIARLFNINLINNFNYPYFSRGIGEFWRRWHASFSGWLLDYVYMPVLLVLRGYRKIASAAALLITFSLSGLWHGPRMTFIVWGIINALIISFNFAGITKWQPSVDKTYDFGGFLKMIVVFIFTTFAWVIFRSADIPSAIMYLSGIFSASLFSMPSNFPIKAVMFIAFFILIEWRGKDTLCPISILLPRKSKALRWAVYYLIIAAVFLFSGGPRHFIYSRF